LLGQSLNLQKDSISLSKYNKMVESKDSIPPILITKKENGYWYDLHEKRMQNLYRKIQIFKRQEETLYDCNLLVNQVIEAKKQSDSNQIRLQKEVLNLQTKYNSQTFYIQVLETNLKKCESTLVNQKDYSKLLDESYSRAKREKYVMLGGVGLALIMYFIGKRG